jgi:lysozyme
MADKQVSARTRTPQKTSVLIALVGAACAACLVPLTKQSEGRSLTAYYDIARVLTICDGDTREVKLGQRATPAECDARLERNLATHGAAVLKRNPELRDRPYQLAAAIDLAFNIGDAAYAGSTVAKRFSVRDWRGGCDAMLMWNKARVGGPKAPLVVVPGLVARRQRERAVCRRGVG